MRRRGTAAGGWGQEEGAHAEAVASGARRTRCSTMRQAAQTVFAENLPCRPRRRRHQGVHHLGVVDSSDPLSAPRRWVVGLWGLRDLEALVAVIRILELNQVKSAKRMPRGPPPADAPTRRSGRIASLPEQPKHRFEVATLFLG
ncbi:hypothetical protein ZWY2020_039869 [Hordeum vulgare]|nr:hypothetical protein ZWY2020_039869 [Hordeum vulgare]